MRPKSQARRKDPWSWAKQILRRIRRPLSLKQIILFVGAGLLLVGINGYLAYNSKQMVIENERKKALVEEKKQKQEEQHAEQQLVIPASPYRFYDELENRTFYSLEEEEEGGVEFQTVLPPPTFSLISEADNDLPEKIESTEQTIEIAPPIRAPIELLSAIEDEQGEELEQGSSSLDVVTESVRNPIIETQPKKVEPNFRKLQTGSFQALNEANVQRKQLEAYGYNPQIIRADNNGKTIYRVHIGPFALNELSSIKSDLKEKRFDFFEVR